MLRRTPQDALQLIENERGLVRVLISDADENGHLHYLLDQLADPENVRPVRALAPTADRSFKYNHKAKAFLPRELKSTDRGRAKPGIERIKALPGSLLPQDGRMNLYNHAKIN